MVASNIFGHTTRNIARPYILDVVGNEVAAMLHLATGGALPGLNGQRDCEHQQADPDRKDARP